MRQPATATVATPNRTAINAPIASAPRWGGGIPALRGSVPVVLVVADSTDCVVVMARHHAGRCRTTSPPFTMWTGLRRTTATGCVACTTTGCPRSQPFDRSGEVEVVLGDGVLGVRRDRDLEIVGTELQKNRMVVMAVAEGADG